MKNAGGQYVCRDLTEFALRALSLPISNAVVERVFRIMNIVKSKMRNRMQLSIMNAITRIRLFFSVQKFVAAYCNKFLPTDAMLPMHNSKIYKRQMTDASGPSTSTAGTSNNENFSDVSGELLEEVVLLLEDD